MKTYLELNLMLAFGWIAFRLIQGFSQKGLSLSAQFWLRLSRWVLLALLGFSSISAVIPARPHFNPPVRVMTPAVGSGFTIQTSHSPRLSIPTLDSNLSLSFSLSQNAITWVEGAAILGVLLFWIALVLKFVRLYRGVAALPVIRKIGRVRIVVSREATIPFSTALFRCAYVVIPEAMVGDLVSIRIAVAHELQHHRQGDTLWVYGLEMLKACFFWNPFAYAWIRTSDHLQEFATDEFLIRIRKISLEAYGRCLLEAANHALSPFDRLVGTTSMAAGFGGKTLKRRIEMLFEYQKRTAMGAVKKWIANGMVVGTLGLLATVAYAERGLVQDRTLTYAQAVEYAHQSNVNPKFPIEMNAAVYAELNREISNEGSRASIKDALKRMAVYEPMIRQKIEGFELANELLAVPIVESRYQNYFSANSVGAGLWGFVVNTGLNYGLHINEIGHPEKDERLVPHRETLAAMRYFTKLRHEYDRDWRLALLGYNWGEKELNRKIEAFGTRDPWELEQKGKGDSHYLAQVISAVIILRNPQLVQ